MELIESTLIPKEQKLAEYIIEENIENIRAEWEKYHGKIDG